MDDKKTRRRRRLRRHGGAVNVVALMANLPAFFYRHERDPGMVLINVRRAMKKCAPLSY